MVAHVYHWTNDVFLISKKLWQYKVSKHRSTKDKCRSICCLFQCSQIQSNVNRHQDECEDVNEWVEGSSSVPSTKGPRTSRFAAPNKVVPRHTRSGRRRTRLQSAKNIFPRSLLSLDGLFHVSVLQPLFSLLWFPMNRCREFAGQRIQPGSQIDVLFAGRHLVQFVQIECKLRIPRKRSKGAPIFDQRFHDRDIVRSPSGNFDRQCQRGRHSDYHGSWLNAVGRD
mmetsp:Transcript_20138/g.35469  ORF Transcript_20138/g.35469 Transcript_20138/m.35469 type:complete len:225 (-) Transcript_20138:136-810(-)